MIKIFQSQNERLVEGMDGAYPAELIEITKDKTEIRHPVNEKLTRPWIKHYFMSSRTRNSDGSDDIIARDTNLLELFKTTIPLPENSFAESSLNSWKLFLETSFRDGEAPWYNGIKKILIRDRFFGAIEQLELEMPLSNSQRAYQFYDHSRSLRRFPRVPIKLFFSLPGNEREILLSIVRQSVKDNPHNTDVALITYAFLKAWGRESEFIELAREEQRADLEEWYHWVEGHLKEIATLKRTSGDHITSFFIYEQSRLSTQEYKEIADWFLRENEFKCAYHFYCKAKEYETALDLLQNISLKEFLDLTNLRRFSKNEKTYDLINDSARVATLYQEELDTLRGYARIRAAGTYKNVTERAREQFDRETVEIKYAFGELTEDEYQRLIRQTKDRAQ